MDLVRVFVEELPLAVLALDNGFETAAMVRKGIDGRWILEVTHSSFLPCFADEFLEEVKNFRGTLYMFGNDDGWVYGASLRSTDEREHVYVEC